MMATMRSLLMALILLPALAMAEAPCAGEGDPFIERPGFGAATPLPTAEAPALSRRDGGTLVLQGELGPIRLADHPACAESSDHVECVTHRLVAAFAAPRGYLVQRQHYEHADHLWVDAIQGQRESLAHLPRFSASLGWMVSVSPSTYAALNGIEVFDLSRGGVIRTWQHVPRQGVERYAHFTFWRWTGEEEALLCAWRGSPPEMTGPEPVMLRRGEFGWRIEPL
ncbi:hypothetical protein G3576_03905 [Roseomonas stagni]|uniref:Uncharacterized protein n=1 Tax=Falsiroseomonas algicola TaxID=2716930 RepID=A0A6M1LFQ5_9PROT|nr:hypothetical protein [Falsiroseomonas algicola]NGM19146.1 hypothetical protein [Falsiroseomonas algicola]